MKKTSLICVALLLSACGGSDYNPQAQTPAPATPPPVTPPVPAQDAYFASVKGQSANMPEDSEPASIDAVVVTAPEDTEPGDV